MPWHHKLHKGGLGTKVLADIGSGVGAGIAALDEDLTINGQTVTNTFRYEAKNATTGLWTATTGEDLTGKASGGTVGLDTPLPGTADEAVAPEATRHWDYSDNVFADITTEDIVIEALFKTPPDTAVRAIGGKWNATTGYLLYVSGGSLTLQIRSGAGSFAQPLYSVDADTWYHSITFLDRSGSGVTYANGSPGTAVSLAAATGSISNSDEPLTIGEASSSAYPYTGQIAYFALWAQANWLDTHLQATVAQERFHRLTGVYSSRYGGPVQTSLRNSSAILEKQGNVGYQRLFTVGPRWPRIETVPDKHNRYASGLHVETSHTNNALWSEELDNASWTKTRVTISADANTAPDGEATMDTIAEDGTGATSHFIESASIALSTATAYVFQAFVKPLNRTWVAIQWANVPVTQTVYFNIADGIVGTQSNNDDAGIRYVGDGIYFIWMTGTTDGADATGNLRFFLCEGDNDAIFDGLTQDSIALWGVMVAASTHPVSYIKTDGSTVARVADELEYTGLPLKQKTTLIADVLTEHPVATTGVALELSDDTVNTRHLIYESTGTIRYYGITGGVNTWTITDAGSEYASRAWFQHRGILSAAQASMHIDGSEVGTPDTSVTPPTCTKIAIGSVYSGTAQLNGLVRARILSADNELLSITDFGDIMAKASGYISTPAAVAQSTSYANVGGTFTSVDLTDFTLSAAGVLTYTGTDTKRFVISAACSGSISSGTPEVTTAIEKNGTEVVSSLSKRDVGGSGIGAWAIMADVELATNDTVNLATKVDAGTPNLTMEVLSIVAHEF